MGLKKCPICELNYIDENEDMCNICLRARKRVGDNEEYALCTVCGERPVTSDIGICADCLHHSKLELTDADTVSHDAITVPVGDVSIDSGLEAMELPLDSDDTIPESEYMEITRDLDMDRDDIDNFDEDEEPYSDSIDFTDNKIDLEEDNAAAVYMNSNEKVREDSLVKPRLK